MSGDPPLIAGGCSHLFMTYIHGIKNMCPKTFSSPKIPVSLSECVQELEFIYTFILFLLQ